MRVAVQNDPSRPHLRERERGKSSLGHVDAGGDVMDDPVDSFEQHGAGDRAAALDVPVVRYDLVQLQTLDRVGERCS